MTNTYPTVEWLRAKLGTDKWVVANRLTQRLKDKGYTKAITQKAYSKLVLEYKQENQ